MGRGRRTLHDIGGLGQTVNVKVSGLDSGKRVDDHYKNPLGNTTHIRREGDRRTVGPNRRKIPDR